MIADAPGQDVLLDVQVIDDVPKPCCTCSTQTGRCGGARNWQMPCCGLNVLGAKSTAGDMVVVRVVKYLSALPYLYVRAAWLRVGSPWSGSPVRGGE